MTSRAGISAARPTIKGIYAGGGDYGLAPERMAPVHQPIWRRVNPAEVRAWTAINERCRSAYYSRFMSNGEVR